MDDFKVGDRVRCIRGVEGSNVMAHEPLKTGEIYVVKSVNGTHITVEGIGLRYMKDRFIKDEA